MENIIRFSRLYNMYFEVRIVASTNWLVCFGIGVQAKAIHRFHRKHISISLYSIIFYEQLHFLTIFYWILTTERDKFTPTSKHRFQTSGRHGLVVTNRPFRADEIEIGCYTDILRISYVSYYIALYFAMQHISSRLLSEEVLLQRADGERRSIILLWYTERMSL